MPFNCRSRILVRRAAKNGIDGKDGTTGKGIVSITNYFSRSRSKTTAPAGYGTNPSTNWSTTPPDLTAAYKYMWQFQVIVWSDNTSTYSPPSVFITRPADGADGLQGMLLRHTEWQPGVEYHNDQALTTGIRFLDICIVTQGVNTYSAYQCLRTHTSSEDITYLNTTYWAPFNMMQPIYTPLIIAANALLRFAQTNQLLVMKSDNETVNVGLGGGSIPFWIGAVNPEDAPCYVDEFGIIHSQSAVFKNPLVIEDCYDRTSKEDWSLVPVASRPYVDDTRCYDENIEDQASPAYIDLDGSEYRQFNITRIGIYLIDADGVFDNGSFILYKFDREFVFNFSNLVQNVIYSVTFKIKHTGIIPNPALLEDPDATPRQVNQEYYHNHNSIPRIGCYDGEELMLGVVALVIKDVNRNVTYKSTEANLNSALYDNQLHPRMAARIEPGNGQICSFQFIENTSNEIRIVSFHSEYIKPSKNYE